MKNQRKRRKLFKRLISGVSALALSVGLLGSIPASADDSNIGYKYTLFAYSSEEGAITSSAANFCVNGNIATNGTISAGQNFNVNGEKKEHANEAMPDLTKDINEEFFTENVDVKAENYKNEDVNINVVSPLDVKGKAELKGNIKLAAGVKAMGDITLSGGVLNNDNTVLFSENGNVVINSENVSLTGLVYAPKGNIVIDSKCLNLNSVVMIANKITLNSSNININNSASMAKFVQESIDKNGGSNGNDESDPEADPVIYAYGEYNEETKSVDIEWYSNVTGEFAVLESMNGTDYTVVSKVSDDTKYSIKITSDFIKKYFKVATIKGTETFESIPFTIVNANGTYSTELLDTDKDGLADLYQEMLGTDKTLPDTDNDGLTDYEEAYKTGTDPTKYDSVTEGVSDANADNDKDGLTNKREIKLKTDPNSDDTDGDNLKDGDEISKYNTDPLKKDTDGDGINDGDEVLLKLDPTKTVTNGVKDSEHYFEQEIPADSKVFSEINTEDSPYTLSMKINCTGYAESNVTASESSYHSAIESEMTVGKIADISLNETCKNKEIVLYYKINNADEDSSSDNDTELKGINKYCIFSYDKEHNAAIPVMTYYDEANSTIYASVKDLGPYWVGNMQIWIDSIENIDPDNFSTTQEVIEKADVVFSVNTCGAGLGDSDLKMMKDNIKDNAELIFKNSKDVRIAVLGFAQQVDADPFCQHTYLSNSKNEWAANIDELSELLDQLKIDNESTYGMLEFGLQDIACPILGVGQPYSFREDADTYSFVYSRSNRLANFGSSFDIYRLDRICSLKAIIDKLELLGIKTSFAFNDERQSTIYVLRSNITDKTGGTFTTYTTDEFGVRSTGVYDYIKSTAKKLTIDNPDSTFGHTVFMSTLSLQPIKLSAPLYANGKNDTDSDGLTDWEEVIKDVDIYLASYMIESKSNKYGYSCVPTYRDVMRIKHFNTNDPIYEDLQKRCGDKYEAIMNMPCLVLYSDPTKDDTDGDLDNDNIDPHPCNYQLNDCFISQLQELQVLAKEYNDDLENKSEETPKYNASKYTVSKEYWYVFMFIRQFNSLYTKDNWSLAGGRVETEFIDYVKSKDATLYEFFSNTTHIYANDKKESMDLRHFAATMTVYIYRTSFGDDVPSMLVALILLYNGEKYNKTDLLPKGGLMPEKHIDNLGGWAGDLQQLMRETNDIYLSENKDHCQSFNDLLNDKNDGGFKQDDMYADIDAHNIYLLLLAAPVLFSSSDLSAVFSRYYNLIYNVRFTLFANAKDLDPLEDTVLVYTKSKYKFIHWPLLKKDSKKEISEDFYPSDSLSKDFRDLFVKFINGRVSYEKDNLQYINSNTYNNYNDILSLFISHLR